MRYEFLRSFSSSEGSGPSRRALRAQIHELIFDKKTTSSVSPTTNSPKVQLAGNHQPGVEGGHLALFEWKFRE